MSKINFQAIASSKGNTLDSIDMKRSYSPSKKFSQSFNCKISILKFMI